MLFRSCFGGDAPEHGQGQPQEKDELEDKVEGKPVNNVEEALDDGEEGEDDPVLQTERQQIIRHQVRDDGPPWKWGRRGTHRQPLRVVIRRGGEEGVERVVARDDEAGKVGEQLAAEVEDDEEEVEGGDADDGVGLGDARRLLEVVEGRVLGQLRACFVSAAGDGALALRYKCRRTAIGRTSWSRVLR